MENDKLIEIDHQKLKNKIKIDEIEYDELSSLLFI